MRWRAEELIEGLSLFFQKIKIQILRSCLSIFHVYKCKEKLNFVLSWNKLAEYSKQLVCFATTGKDYGGIQVLELRKLGRETHAFQSFLHWGASGDGEYEN